MVNKEVKQFMTKYIDILKSGAFENISRKERWEVLDEKLGEEHRRAISQMFNLAKEPSTLLEEAKATKQLHAGKLNIDDLDSVAGGGTTIVFNDRYTQVNNTTIQQIPTVELSVKGRVGGNLTMASGSAKELRNQHAAIQSTQGAF